MLRKKKDYALLEAQRKEEYIEELTNEIDVQVKKLVEVFRFILKYRLLFRGSGVEFASLREYVPMQDDATKIDWKTSLRAHKLYVKQYEEERDLDVYILLDTSSSMLFGTQERLKSEYSAIVAGAIAYAAIESGDNVGFSIFNDNLVATSDPVGDPTQYYKLLRALADPDNYGGRSNLENALTYLINCLGSRTILFIISDYIGLDDRWDNALKMMSGKLDRVVGIMVRDIRDSFLEEGVGTMKLRDPLTDSALLVNIDKVKVEFEKATRRQEKRIEFSFQEGGMGFVKVYTDEPFVEPLIKYLELGESH